MTIADDKPLSLVHVLSNRIGRAFHGEIETKFGITIAEWRVLLTLASEKRPARACGVAPGDELSSSRVKREHRRGHCRWTYDRSL